MIPIFEQTERSFDASICEEHSMSKPVSDSPITKPPLPAALLSGQCSCGKCRYQSESEPLFMFLCHCRRCQKNAGGPCTAGIALPLAAVSFSGDLSSFNEVAESGNQLTVQFCRDCGVFLSDYSSGFADVIILSAPTLDKPSIFTPQANCWLSSKADWQAIDPDLMGFEKNPD